MTKPAEKPKSNSIAPKKDKVKSARSNNSTGYEITQLNKWEQKNFVRLLEEKNWNGAKAIMDLTLKTAEAKRLWWDREDAKPHMAEYYSWLLSKREKAGENSWQMWDRVLEETRYSMGVDAKPDKNAGATVSLNFNQIVSEKGSDYSD